MRPGGGGGRVVVVVVLQTNGDTKFAGLDRVDLCNQTLYVGFPKKQDQLSKLLKGLFFGRGTHKCRLIQLVLR